LQNNINNIIASVILLFQSLHKHWQPSWPWPMDSQPENEP